MPSHFRIFLICSPGLPQQGEDHGGTRHDQQRSEKNRELDIKFEKPIGRGCRESPGNQRPQQDQAEDHLPGLAKLGDPEGQASLEENDRHRERYDREEQLLAEQSLGIDEAETCLAGGKTHSQQEKDRGQPQPPRQPLRAQPHHDNRRKAQQYLLMLVFQARNHPG